jgi:amino acid adenylation domain-containing protein
VSGVSERISQLSPNKQELLLRHLAARRTPPAAGAEEGIRPHAAGRTRFPLSFGQQRLWFLDRLRPGSAAYNVSEGLRLSGPLDSAALRVAVGEVLRRHEVLRATFALDGDAPVQVIGPAAGPPLPLLDLASLSTEAREDELLRLAAREAARPFDLACGPLCRFRLVRLGTADHALLVALHHIVSDAGSMEILFGELQALYAAGAAGAPPPLPPVPVQYTDYAEWQRGWLEGERLERQLAWWRERLAGAPAALPLPTDRPRPAVQTDQGARHLLSVPDGTAAALRALAQREGATPYMVCLAAFAALLSRATREEDLLVGSPVANRTRPEVERLIGFFVNTLVLRIDLREAPDFRTLLGRVRQTCLAAFANADLPFERIVEEVQPERDLGRMPLFQVLFSLLGGGPPGRGALAPGVSVSRVRVRSRSSKLDLNLAMVEAGGHLSGSLEYNTDLFDATTAARLGDHLGRLLAGVARDPEAPLAEVPLLGPAELHQILVEWNHAPAAASIQDTIPARFAARAAEAPDAVAAVCGDQALTFRDLAAAAGRLARLLRRLGVGAETRVGLYFERNLDMLVSVLGVQLAGGAYLPLDARFPAERLAFMLEDAGVPVVLTQERLRGALPAGRFRVLCLDAAAEREALAREIPEPLPPAAFPESIAYVIYTSGSTGRPKGVLIEHRQMLAYVRALTHRLGVPAPAAWGMAQPLAVDSSYTVFYPALLTGGRLVLIPEERAADPAALAEDLERHGVDVLKIAPSHLLALQTAARPERLLPRQRLVLGGEASRRDWAEGLRDLKPGCAVVNHYGPTETTVGVLTFRVPERARHATRTVPLGRPLDDAVCHVVDGRLRPVPIGVPGELLVGGECVTRGYLGRPDLTAERFVPSPFAGLGARLYRTGDLARRLADGTLEFLGRIDHQMKIRGFRIEPGEIEAALLRHPAVADCAVVARDGPGRETFLVAYVVPAPGADAPGGAELRAHLAARLPDYMVPAVFVQLAGLPRTAQGKLDRRSLPAPDLARDRPRAGGVPPRDLVELRLSRLWEDLLGVEEVGVHDDFFELGGHSLMAVRLMTRIEQRFGRSLPLSTLFEGATVEALARALRRQPGGVGASPMVEIQPGADGERPLFLIHPAGGNVLCYLPLARHLGRGQPVFGLQDPNFESAEEPRFVIPEMVALYLDAVRAAQPRGPYRLGGWSLGGVLAQEMARQLEGAGEEVEQLLLIDARSPTTLEAEWGRERSAADLLLWFAAQLGVPVSREEIEALPPAERFPAVLARGQAAGRLPADLDPERALHIFEVYRTEMSAERTHRPAPCHCRITLIRAAAGIEDEQRKGEDHALGWRGLSGTGLTIEVIPGAHQTLMDEPHVHALAREIRARLDAVSCVEGDR